jgi:peroxiredoxin
MNLPSSFVIDRDGIVRLQWVGGIDRKSLEKYVTPIILEEP